VLRPTERHHAIRGANLVLALLCHRHHWMVHEGQWQLAPTEAGDYLALPPTPALFRGAASEPDVGSVA